MHLALLLVNFSIFLPRFILCCSNPTQWHRQRFAVSCSAQSSRAGLQDSRACVVLTPRMCCRDSHLVGPDDDLQQCPRGLATRARSLEPAPYNDAFAAGQRHPHSREAGESSVASLYVSSHPPSPFTLTSEGTSWQSQRRYGHLSDFVEYRKSTSVLVPLPPGQWASTPKVIRFIFLFDWDW